MPLKHRHRRHRQSGVATLAITMLLLFALSMVALYANRSLVVEQRASASQYRAVQAFEAAEAGLEWTLARLNDPRGVDAACSASGGNPSFRDRYLPMNDEHALTVASVSGPGCTVGKSGLVCRCAPAGGALPPVDDAESAFRIAFEPIAGEAHSIRVVSEGCSRLSASCEDGSGAARVSAVLKLRPLLRQLPGAALTVGGDVALFTGSTLFNTDDTTAGALIEAGGTVAIEPGVRLVSLPGAAGLAAIAAREPSLERLQGSSRMLEAFAGMKAEAFRRHSTVKQIDAATPGARGQALLDAHADGFTAFHSTGDIEFDRAVIGSSAQPVLIVGDQAAVRCSQACVIHGIVLHDMQVPTEGGGIPMQVQGAVIAAGDHHHGSNESIAYNVDVLDSLRLRAAFFVKLPGSWRDF